MSNALQNEKGIVKIQVTMLGCISARALRQPGISIWPRDRQRNSVGGVWRCYVLGSSSRLWSCKDGQWGLSSLLCLWGGRDTVCFHRPALQLCDHHTFGGGGGGCLRYQHKLQEVAGEGKIPLAAKKSGGAMCSNNCVWRWRGSLPLPPHPANAGLSQMIPSVKSEMIHFRMQWRVVKGIVCLSIISYGKAHFDMWAFCITTMLAEPIVLINQCTIVHRGLMKNLLIGLF